MNIEENDLLRVQILWPSGALMPVVIRKDVTVTELISILKYSQSQSFDLHLFHRGYLMNPCKTVASQCSADNDILSVGFVKFHGIQQNVDFSQWLRTQTKVQEIYREALRINDFKFDVLEANPSIIFTYNEAAGASDDQDEQEGKSQIVVEKSQSINTEPLPAFWEKNADNDQGQNVIVVPYFGSIEEAGDFFSKKKWGGWTW